MYLVYILQSKLSGRYYIGQTINLDKRLKRHNSGLVKSTRSGAPWIVVHREEFITRQAAYKRERQIKSYKGGAAFKRLFKNKID
ncbi:MAG: GIY-YIG nuclease family protein [Candidatus Komeilibacteria bacterium]